ncbi:MAG TPA: hypothetical protein PK819_12680 [Thermomicrobiales bacterium]|nr:hypothetical protein [Thermomicrobiales bacterium]
MARRRSPYYAKYLEFGAELVDRMGYDAPAKFTSIEEEHLATRQAAGLYDVYHQGKVEIKGREAEALLQKACVNDLTRIGDGEVLYSSMCNAQGGMIDDLTIYRVAGDSFFLSPTPSRVDAVVAHLNGLAHDFDAYVTNSVPGTGFISVQGPHAGRPDQRQVAKTAWRALALAGYNLGDPAVARAALGRLLRADPRSLADATLWPLLLRATVAWPLVRHRRLARRRAAERS